jgi:hypothetical protein
MNVNTENVAEVAGTAGWKGAMPVDVIKRTTGPQTTNGRRWEVQLSATPPLEWMELFKVSGDSSARAVPQRVEFDRTSAYFRSDEGEVEYWVASIDRWIAATNAKHQRALEEVRQQRVNRLDAETRERERIQRLNDRFKNL